MESTVELTNSLNQIESGKQLSNASANLSEECNSIKELDNRVCSLLTEIKSFKDSINQYTVSIDTTCDRLQPCAQILDRASFVFDLNTRLMELHRLSKRLDKNQIFKLARAFDKNTTTAPQTNADDGHLLNFAAVEESALQEARDIIDKFELNYKPLEYILVKRQDLPYAAYANTVKRAKMCIESGSYYANGATNNGSSNFNENSSNKTSSAPGT